MHFCYDDLLRLVRPVPFMHLGRPSSALTMLTRASDDAEELGSVLRQYPRLRYQALDFHYICLQSLGALDERLVNDLVTELGWRGLVWASLLTCLSPTQEYRELLHTARPQWPMQAWAVDLALGNLGANCPGELEALMIQVKRLREALAACAIPRVSLRRGESSSLVEARRAVVLAEYRRGGRDAALRAIAGRDAVPACGRSDQ